MHQLLSEALPLHSGANATVYGEFYVFAGLVLWRQA